jgi:predicted CoA-substrate-specific enzyme activase
MITAGIDVGLENIKIVILHDGKIAAKASGSSGGGDRNKQVEKVWQSALDMAGIDRKDVSSIIATGIGKTSAPFAGAEIVEPLADAKAAYFINSAVTTVVDAGADQTRVVALGKGDAITEVVFNQKCMAGIGLALEVVARRLNYTVEEMSSVKIVPDMVNDGCPVFAEMDAIELLNKGATRETAMGAITEMAVVRLNSILHDKFFPDGQKTMLIGGVAKNAAVVAALKERSGIDFIIPENPEYGCALGAAVFGMTETGIE